MTNFDTARELSSILSLLTSILGRILQTTDRKAGLMIRVGTAVLAKSAFALSTTGAIAYLGTASTGAAIAGLSGVAKTTATLFWLGSLVGGGAAFGAVILGVGTLGAGIYGSRRASSAIFGDARSEDTLSDHERRIVRAIQTIAASIQLELNGKKQISHRELALLLRIGITPILTEIERTLSGGGFNKINACNRVRMRCHVKEMRSLQARVEVSDAA